MPPINIAYNFEEKLLTQNTNYATIKFEIYHRFLKNKVIWEVKGYE